MVSGSISLFYSKYFSPFPHGTGSLSVSQKYLALPDGAGSFRRDSSGPALLRILPGSAPLPIRGYHPLWFNFPEIFHYKFTVHVAVLQPRPCRNKTGLGCSPFARHYLGNHYCFLLLRVLRCFRSPGLLPVTRIPRLQRGGLPHSEISGSKVVCTSPKLIAAYHVLHRLSVPRHPPCALSSLIENLLIEHPTATRLRSL